MFSNITEAWNYDPVKEMTDKLSKGAFRTNTDQSEIFNFKSQSNNINQTKINNAKPKDIISLSDGNSLSLLSENTTGINTLDSDFGSFAPVNFDKYSNNKKKQNKNKHSKRYDSISSDSDLSSTDSLEESRCDYSVKHLKKCDRCYDRLKKLVNSKVNRKFDEIILDTKMKQLQNVTVPQFPILQQPQAQSYAQNIPTPNSDSWKETLIIVIGAIIAIFIIFLIVKAMHK
ncbi:hypothetical protein QJ856_gp0619 [Tupanvirus deep ocean]|uniref:Uncharacterized protein n=2 Tax=Tupanvirus TaxID=2094720 RepID=A0AC62A8Q4_9VIRU|nr:hypothetical protein QJ856_gp0619 [Tupanvirus deep ocean]QKU34127.1 hypothetical protein [Tupanvirus deep ocean]